MAMLMSQAANVMFGAGALKSLGDQIKAKGFKKAIIVTDKGVSDIGITAKVEAVIKDAGAACAVFDGCLSDAPSDTVPHAAKAARDFGADVMIALGGGSSIDTAKVAALVIKEEKPITPQLSSRENPPIPDIPVIIVPTTSGTGSEVTYVAVLSDKETSGKFGVHFSGPLISIVDPELTMGMPAHLTANTGMDVVAHAVEAVIGVMRNPMSDLRGYEALRLVSAHLGNAVKHENCITSRSGMALASSLAGMAFNDSVTSLGHAISQALAPLHVHHGLLCGLATPVQIELAAPAVPERVRKIGEIFGADIPLDATPEEIGKLAANAMRKFMSLVGVKSLEQLGLTKEQVVGLTDALMAEFMLNFFPVKVTRDVAEKSLDMMFIYKG